MRRIATKTTATAWIAATAALGATLASAPCRAGDDRVEETRVYAGACLAAADDAPRVSGLATAAVGSTIRGGLGRLGAALRAAGAARSRTAVARLNLQLEPGETPRCVQLARGTFGRCERMSAPWVPPAAIVEGVRTADALRRELLAAGLCLDDEPSVFVEVAIRHASGERAVALAPTLLHYGRTLDGRRGASSRALALQLVWHGPGESADSRDATGAAVVFGDVEPGRSTRFERIRPRSVWPHESAWFPSPFPPPAAPARPADDLDLTQGSPESAPSTLTATLIETRDERPLLLFAADLLQGSADELEAELQALVLSDKRRELELADERRRQLALLDFETKRSAAFLKRIEYCALSDDDTAPSRALRLATSTELLRAEVEANLAAAAAGRPRPFPEPIAPTSGPRRGC